MEGSPSLLVLEAPQLGPSFLHCILDIKLLFELSLESIPSGDGGGPFVDIVAPRTPPNRSNIFKREGSMVYLLCFINDAYRSKVGLELPKKVVYLPCIPNPVVGWSLKCILLWGSGHLTRSTSVCIGHRDHAYFELGFQGLNPYLVCLNLRVVSHQLGFASLGLSIPKSSYLLIDIVCQGFHNRLHLCTELLQAPRGFELLDALLHVIHPNCEVRHRVVNHRKFVIYKDRQFLVLVLALLPSLLRVASISDT